MTETETTTENNYCPHCGDAISEPGAFCGACGSALGTGGSRAASPDAALRPSVPTPSPAAAPHSAPARAPSPTMRDVGADPAPATPHSGPPPPAHPIPPAPTAAPATGGRRWIPYAVVGGAAVLLAAIVTTVLLLISGSAGSNVKAASATRSDVQKLLAAEGTTVVSPAAPGLFALVRANRLQALVPAGWRATAQTGTGIGRAQFTDPKQSSNTLTIVDQNGAGPGDRAEAVLARSGAVAKGYPVSYFGQDQFPGGRIAWRVTYAAASITNTIYFFQACNGTRSEVVHVSAATKTFAAQAATLGLLAASAEPLC